MLHFEKLIPYWPAFVSGTFTTIYLTIFCMIGGFVLAIPIALMKISKSKVLQKIGYIYTDIFRGRPPWCSCISSILAFPVSVSCWIPLPPPLSPRP